MVKSPVIIHAQAKSRLEWNLFLVTLGTLPAKVLANILIGKELYFFENHNGRNQRHHKNPGEGS